MHFFKFGRNLSVLLNHSYRSSFPSLIQTSSKSRTLLSKPLNMSTSGQLNNQNPPAPIQISKTEQLKRAFKDYGATLIIFHISMSLCSLGVWYLIVSSGVDVAELLKKFNIDESKLKIASGASTFVIAYALHKLTAPIRISITLGAAPFIVSYLRRIGILKVKNAAIEPMTPLASKTNESGTSGLTKKSESSESLHPSDKV